MTIERFAALAGVFATAVLLVGCEEAPPPRRSSFLQDNPWVVKKPWETAKAGSNPVVQPGGSSSTVAASPGVADAHTSGPPVAYKPDTEIVSPILEAKGNWTVRLAFYNPAPDKGLSALYYANQHARTLIKQGYPAYVTDLISKAIVSVGAFDSENDPKLLEMWRGAYEDWLKIYGGRKSPFREEMERFYGGQTVFGDQPWPVSIIDLQIKMKGAWKIPLTEQDKQRYKEYISKRVKTGENP